MKKIFKFYPYPMDYAVTAVFVVLAFVFLLGKFRQSQTPLYAVIETSLGENYSLSLSRDTIIDVKGKIGTSRIEIKSGKARILFSPCPAKICVKRGWIHKPWESAACIPNGVWLYIKADNNNIDAVTY